MRVELGVSLGGLNLIKKNIGNGKKKHCSGKIHG